MTYSDNLDQLVSDVILHLPEVLDDAQKNALARSINSLANGEDIDYSNYFETTQTLPPNQLSQGDAYESLPYITLPIKTLPLTDIPMRPSMIISNSCAISPDRSNALPSRVLYAPIIRLDKLEALILEKAPKSIQLISDIKRQQPMNYFYLPEQAGKYPESVVLFDHMLSIDISAVQDDDLSAKLRYRLSRDSWYHLLIKLSAYLTRITNELVTERA
jgi:hypothetical protein